MTNREQRFQEKSFKAIKRILTASETKNNTETLKWEKIILFLIYKYENNYKEEDKQYLNELKQILIDRMGGSINDIEKEWINQSLQTLHSLNDLNETPTELLVTIYLMLSAYLGIYLQDVKFDYLKENET